MKSRFGGAPATLKNWQFWTIFARAELKRAVVSVGKPVGAKANYKKF